jgi:HD superfamily phosphohydrolase
VDQKGIYSVEKFITSRRLMYWQAYMHKTVVAAEHMLIKTLKRAQQLVQEGEKLFATPALQFFLENKVSKEDFDTNPEVLENFLKLDDNDILASIKVWTEHKDRVLQLFSRGIIHRRLLKAQFFNEQISQERLDLEVELAMTTLDLPREDAAWFVIPDVLTNKAYSTDRDQIQILRSDGSGIVPLPQASDNLNISALSTSVSKPLLCYPTSSML